MIFKLFLSAIIKTLNLPRKNHSGSIIVELVRNPFVKKYTKQHKHLIILAIKGNIKSGLLFTFKHITKEVAMKEIISFTKK